MRDYSSNPLTAYEKVGKQDAQQHPVGTGPFKLAKWEQNNLIVLEKNTDYWTPGSPYLDRIEFKIMKDGVTPLPLYGPGEGTMTSVGSRASTLIGS